MGRPCEGLPGSRIPPAKLEVSTWRTLTDQKSLTRPVLDLRELHHSLSHVHLLLSPNSSRRVATLAGGDRQVLCLDSPEPCLSFLMACQCLGHPLQLDGVTGGGGFEARLGCLPLLVELLGLRSLALKLLILLMQLGPELGEGQCLSIQSVPFTFRDGCPKQSVTMSQVLGVVQDGKPSVTCLVDHGSMAQRAAPVRKRVVNDIRGRRSPRGYRVAVGDICELSAECRRIGSKSLELFAVMPAPTRLGVGHGLVLQMADHCFGEKLSSASNRKVAQQSSAVMDWRYPPPLFDNPVTSLLDLRIGAGNQSCRNDHLNPVPVLSHQAVADSKNGIRLARIIHAGWHIGAPSQRDWRILRRIGGDQAPASWDNDELVGIEGNRPIGLVIGDGDVVHEPSQALGKVFSGARVLDNLKRQPFIAQGLQDGKSAVGAAVVEDYELSGEAERVAHEALDDINFIPYARNRNDAHDLARASYLELGLGTGPHRS